MPDTHPQSVAQFRDNLQRVRATIDSEATKCGRRGEDVRLIAVSKTYPIETVSLAIQAGMTVLGENRTSELAEKAQALQAVDAEHPLTWCAIGHVQRKKAKDVAAYADEFHALDSLRLAQELNKRLENLDRTLDVFIQVNTSGEEQKGGFEPEEVADFFAELEALPQLRPRGLMTMAAFSQDEAVVRPSFARLRELRDELLPQMPKQYEYFGELSMGMSGDFPWAIQEGATSVRIGTALFGHRTNSAYLRSPGN